MHGDKLCWFVHRNLLIFLCGCHHISRHCFPDCLHQILWHFLNLYHTALHPRQLDHTFHQKLQPLRLMFQTAKRLPSLLRLHFLRQQIQIDSLVRDRYAALVRDVRNQAL